MFKIVSVGWNCAEFLERTLRSVEVQSRDDWEIQITYDPSGDLEDNGADHIRAWCGERDRRWHFTINDERKYAVRNQVEGIQALKPADDDIIVFLDLDGDRLAHVDVLAHLAEYYADGTLLTYGSYKPLPPAIDMPRVMPFPPKVIRDGTYRAHMLTGSCCFNHLRTMSGRIFNNIPLNQFRWPMKGTAMDGQWYVAGTDYVFMVAGLELAGPRHKCIEEVLLLYNNANPHADYLDHPVDADACVQNYLRRPPLRRLED